MADEEATGGNIDITLAAVLTIVEADGTVRTSDQHLKTTVTAEEAEYLKQNAKNLTLVPPGESEEVP